MTTTPPALTAAYRRWTSADHPPQRDFHWNPKAWEKRLSGIGNLSGVDVVASVRSIGDAAATACNGDRGLINRAVVTTLHAPSTLRPGDSEDPQAVVTAFIAAMIWGYGSTGYGPYRTERVLTTDRDAVPHLCEIAEIAQNPERGGLEAFTTIARARNGSYLKYLGPAFGTKFLYFLTEATPAVKTTPVMDAVVRRWFASKADIRLTTARWESSSYERYLAALDHWAAALTDGTGDGPLPRGQVEFLIFATARGDAESWNPNTEEISVDQLLDLLQEDVAYLAEESGSSRGPELLAELADWVAGTGADGEE